MLWTKEQAIELEYAAALEWPLDLQLNADTWLKAALMFDESDPKEVGYMEYALYKAVYLESILCNLKSSLESKSL